MERLQIARPFVTAACALVCIGSQARAQQQLPAVAGYRIGDSWSAVGGRLIPCRSGPDGLNALEKASFLVTDSAMLPYVRICEPSDSVSLRFYRDTLYHVYQTFSEAPQTPIARWTSIREWAISVFGPPDSVVSRTAAGLETVTARWARSSRRDWVAWLQVLAPENVARDPLKRSSAVAMSINYCRVSPAFCR